MQMQPAVSELRAASDEAVAAAQAGLGPLFASHLQTQLLERPKDFVNDQVPLVSAAGRARLALLDAEKAETDAATTPAALKRLLEREVSRVLGAQEQFEARVGEKLDELRTRVEKGEEAVHELVTVKGAELRDELTQLATQQHEKSATELVEKMGAFAGRFENAQLRADAKIAELEAKVAQLELRVLPGTGLVVDHTSLFAKLGYGAETTVDAFKSDIVKKTELKYASKGLNVEDARALAAILGSLGNKIEVQTLDLSNNLIGNVGMVAISDVVQTGALNGLEVLRLEECGLSHMGLHAFTKAWLAYKTFRLTELKLSGMRFDVCEAFALLVPCKEAGLLERLKGPVFKEAEVRQHAENVPHRKRLSEAFNLSGGKVAMVIEGDYEPDKSLTSGGVPPNTVYGSNPYFDHAPTYLEYAPIGEALKHLTGKSTGLVYIQQIETRNFPASSRFDVQSVEAGHEQPKVGYMLLTL